MQKQNSQEPRTYHMVQDRVENDDGIAALSQVPHVINVLSKLGRILKGGMELEP